MYTHLGLLFLVSVSLAALLVKSESTFEVDENGDEYEVKRFNIQGRQLNEGRAQCVEIRRKRAVLPPSSPLYFDNGSNEEIDDDDSDAIKVGDRTDMIFYSPPVISSAVAGEQDEKKEDADAINDMTNEEQEEMPLSYMNVKNNTRSGEDKEIDGQEKGDDDTIEGMELPQFSVSEQPQNAGESTAASTSAVKDETNADGIVVVQSHTPPKVNPQTHAVFQLIPVEDVTSEVDGEFDLDFSEELSPFTSTLSWSNGDDYPSDIYDDDDQQPIRVRKVKKGVNRDREHQKQPAKKPERKNKYNNNLKSGLPTGNRNQNTNKNRPDKANVKRPIKTRKPQTSHGNKNRRPSTNNRKSTLYIVRNKNKTIQNSGQLYGHNGNRIIVKRKKNKKNAQVVVNGEPAFNRIYAWTRIGNDANNNGYANGNVNCIIIRKDTPPTTTQRPFWQFWKRSADGGRQASGHFGKRKRVNMRFVA